jgi:photosystem II stability/assembly factor-like uncharacterized protein
VSSALFSDLHWRNIGPFRGGRAVAVAGVPGDGRTFYFGAVGGGVWKTTNAGVTWNNVSDALPVSSIGALAVAPGDPQTVYAGSGEADMRSDIIHGNGMYRSSDGGRTWSASGLEDSRQIGRIIVDPADPKTLLVAALGHAYGPNETRGVFRSSDGGATWTRTLFHDRDTGAIDLAADPQWHVVFASLWQTRRPPWSVYPPSNGPGTGLYRSADRGLTWQPVRGGGFPSEGLGKIGLAVAPSDPRRVYAIVAAKAGGLYRSDDGGATWRLIDADRRLWERGWYFCHVAVDPKNADVVYVSDTSFYRSRDGGASFSAIKGSPDGDDTHQLWIDPTDPAHMVLGSDQGASVSLDGAETWSTWFNQPTGQFYHVATDAAFPYRLYGAQQDSGAAMILSRSDHAKIQERDWRPISAGGESGYIAPAPGDANVVFGGTVDREDLHSNQTRSVSPTAGVPGLWRGEWTLPLVFGPDGALYFGNQYVWRTRDGGNRWERLGGALTRAHPGVTQNLDPATAADADGTEPLGVVYAIAPSPVRARVIWAGSDDGLVHVSDDAGAHWRDVSPPSLTAWSHVTGIEASHFDARTAYVAVDRHRLDDDRPYLYVTRDGGKSWTEAHAGIPDGSFLNAVREDPVRRGLLYAATETGVFVSFDDAASWQSLQLNMPVVSVRDISVRYGDLAIATHGRAFWILDDVAPLRELVRNAAAGARLFAPRDAIRTRAGNDEAEAIPPEIPAGDNPPNGAYLDYVVPAGAAGPVRLEIVDPAGAVVRQWSSADPAVAPDPADFEFPAFWLSAPVRLLATPGMHRFVWDFHAGDERGPLAPPGRYRVRLSLGGRTFVQTLTLRRDPRVAVDDAGLRAQFALARSIAELQARVKAAIAAAEKRRADMSPEDQVRLDAVVGVPAQADPANSVGSPETHLTTLRYRARLLAELFYQVESADAPPSDADVRNWLALQRKTLQSLLALAVLTLK